MIQQRTKIKSYNQMLVAYQTSCLKIRDRYTNDMNRFTQDSVKTLSSLFQSYINEKKNLVDVCQQTQGNSTQQSSNQRSNFMGKVFEEDSFYCANYPKKPNINKQNEKDKQKQNYILCKHIDKLTLGSMIEDEQEEESYQKKTTHASDLKNKNLAEMIQESQKKMNQRWQKSKKEQNDLLLEDSNSEYQMTEHSSNEESNDGSYSPYVVAQEPQNKPLFGGIFSKSMSSDSNNSFKSNSSNNLLNFNFSSKELLKSPKKLSKSKRSRMYIRAKKIPRWAEDLQQVQRIYSQQTHEQRLELFGKCVVEHLDTNIIFKNKKHSIQRSSSAKWSHQMFIT